MKTVDKILEGLEKLCQIVGAVLLIGMLFSLSVQVISRRVFNTGFSWTEESARYMMVMMVFIGAIVCTKQGIHVAMDAIEELVPKAAPVMKFIQYLVTIVYCVVVCYFGIQILPTAALQTSPNMKVKMSYIYIAIPIAVVLIGIYVVRHLVALFRKETYGAVKSEVEEALEAVKEEEEKP